MPAWNAYDWEDVLKGEPFLRDAQAVAALSDETFENALQAIDAHAGFLGPEALRVSVSKVVSDVESARGLASFLTNLRTLVRDEGSGASFEAKLKDAQSLGAVQQVLLQRLPRLLGKHPGIERHFKAESLAQRLGSRFDNFGIICDLRPVFNETRDLVEGIFPVATMRVEAHDDFLPVELTVTLSFRQLEQIVEEATNAQKKMASLGKLLRERGFDVPEAGFKSSSVNPEKEEPS